MGKVVRTCKNCKAQFTARQADVNRGWAQYCSKSCKATAQVKRGGKYLAYQHQNNDDPNYIDPYDVEGPGWDAHKDIY
jgi:hypothetical protein